MVSESFNNPQGTVGNPAHCPGQSRFRQESHFLPRNFLLQMEVPVWMVNKHWYYGYRSYPVASGKASPVPYLFGSSKNIN